MPIIHLVHKESMWWRCTDWITHITDGEMEAQRHLRGLHKTTRLISDEAESPRQSSESKSLPFLLHPPPWWAFLAEEMLSWSVGAAITEYRNHLQTTEAYFLTLLKARSPRSESMVRRGPSSRLWTSLYPHKVEGGKATSQTSFIKSLISATRALSLHPITSQRAPLPHTITQDMRISIQEFGLVGVEGWGTHTPRPSRCQQGC